MLLFGVVIAEKVIREEAIDDIKGGILDGVGSPSKGSLAKLSRQIDRTP